MSRWLALALIAVAVVAMIVWMNVYNPPKAGDAPSAAALSLTIVVSFAVLIGMLALVAMAYSAVNLADPKEAFGLPSGSIRALLALLITMGFLVLAFPQVTQKVDAGTQDNSGAQGSSGSQGSSGQQGTPKPSPAPVQNPPATQSTPAPPPKSNTLLVLFDTSAYAEPAPNAPVGGTGTTEQKKDSSGSTSILQILGTLMTTIIGFYFGSKSATDATTKVSDALEKASRAAGKQQPPVVP